MSALVAAVFCPNSSGQFGGAPRYDANTATFAFSRMPLRRSRMALRQDCFDALLAAPTAARIAASLHLWRIRAWFFVFDKMVLLGDWQAPQILRAVSSRIFSARSIITRRSHTMNITRVNELYILFAEYAAMNGSPRHGGSATYYHYYVAATCLHFRHYALSSAVSAGDISPLAKARMSARAKCYRPPRRYKHRRWRHLRGSGIDAVIRDY